MLFQTDSFVWKVIGHRPAAKLASETDFGGLVLISPFTSLQDVAKDMVGRRASWIVSPRWKTIEIIPRVQCPTLFLHGKKDKVVPPEHSKMLFQKCTLSQGCKVLQLMDTGHNEIQPTLLVLFIRKFLTKSVFISGLQHSHLCLRIHDSLLLRVHVPLDSIV